MQPFFPKPPSQEAPPSSSHSSKRALEAAISPHAPPPLEAPSGSPFPHPVDEAAPAAQETTGGREKEPVSSSCLPASHHGHTGQTHRRPYSHHGSREHREQREQREGGQHRDQGGQRDQGQHRDQGGQREQGQQREQREQREYGQREQREYGSREQREPREHHAQAQPQPSGPVEVVKIADIQRMEIDNLGLFGRKIGLKHLGGLTRSQMVFYIVKALAERPGELLIGEGVLEVLPDGFGFLRAPNYNYLPSAEDIYISPAQIRRYEMRKGDTVVGTIRSPKEKEKYFALHNVETINGLSVDKSRERILFENLTPLHPNKRLIMETTREQLSTRVLDLVAPIGKGQRGLIVAPPKSGKTIILQNIANAISVNNKEVILMMLLIDERPEEVTEMQRTVKGEVVASTFDEPPERHVQVAEMVIEKARRLVENGNDVVILLDSLTRLARAYNTIQPHSGKILSGGIDANALHKPKRFFGAARNIEQGGSLTIIATAMIDNGSRMDEVIFEEFKGTGNMELVLSRDLADRRVFPAVDVNKSGTRKEELLYHEATTPGGVSEQQQVHRLRQALASLSEFDAMQLLLARLRKSENNAMFLLSIKD